MRGLYRRACTKARVCIGRRRLRRGGVDLHQGLAKIEDVLGPDDRHSLLDDRVGPREEAQREPRPQPVDSIAQLGDVGRLDHGAAQHQRIIGEDRSYQGEIDPSLRPAPYHDRRPRRRRTAIVARHVVV